MSPMRTVYPTKVVLTEGRDSAPARLVVSVDLGHGFRALSPVMQREAIERGLADACVLAEEKVSPTPDSEVSCPPERTERSRALAEVRAVA